MENTLTKLRIINWIVAATAVAAGVGIGVFFGKNLPPVIPLFYSRPWGEEQLVAPLGLVWPVGITVGVEIATVAMAKLFKNEPVLGAIIMASGIIIGVILILGMLRSVMLIV